MIVDLVVRYTSKMLLAAIAENHQGTYDFFYLPIDFKVSHRLSCTDRLVFFLDVVS